MATRSGTVDPGMVTWLVEHAGVNINDVSDALEHRSGLVALAGTADMVAVLNKAKDGDARSQLALGVYVHKLRAGIASMASAMNGIDLLVFTGGVGENAPSVRSRTVQGLAFLGAGLDEEANLAPHPDTELTDPRSAVRIAVVAAREDIQIASEVRSLLSSGRSMRS